MVVSSQSSRLIYSFLSVVVIMCASLAQGHRFESGRKHSPFLVLNAVCNQAEYNIDCSFYVCAYSNSCC